MAAFGQSKIILENLKSVVRPGRRSNQIAAGNYIPPLFEYFDNHSLEIHMFSVLRFPLAICVAVFSLNAHAYSSVAGSGADVATIAYSANVENAADADEQAIRNCQKKPNARLQGAAPCQVLERSTGPGYGALVCDRSVTFCSYTLGAVSQNSAMTQARDACIQSGATACPRAVMWKDFAGWPIQTP